ncbi:MAG: toll/interleukin-1 receptor domain-containing protein [Rhodospirillales bacterium]|nr:toll/interleukin-1 receptor domain-containing protein [Rhodospirillales bacterium]
MKKSRAFFSYARANSEYVLRLAKDLRAAGINLWLDQLDIAPGERWDQSIQQALEDCGTLLVILSPASVRSQNVMDEVSFALQAQKRILPIVYEHCEIPFRLRRLQYIDLTDNDAPDYSRLLDVLASEPAPRWEREHSQPEQRTRHDAPPSPAAPAVSAKGGFNFGCVGGNVSVRAGGDIVAGDKVIQTTTTTTTISTGFKKEDDKQRFLHEIDELCATLRRLQAKMHETPGLDEDITDEMTGDLLRQIGALKLIKSVAAALAIAEQPPPEERKNIESALQGACSVLDKVKGVCDRSLGAAEAVAACIGKAMPLVLSARHLFGLP